MSCDTNARVARGRVDVDGGVSGGAASGAREQADIALLLLGRSLALVLGVGVVCEYDGGCGGGGACARATRLAAGERAVACASQRGEGGRAVSVLVPVVERRR